MIEFKAKGYIIRILNEFFILIIIFPYYAVVSYQNEFAMLVALFFPFHAYIKKKFRYVIELKFNDQEKYLTLRYLSLFSIKRVITIPYDKIIFKQTYMMSLNKIIRLYNKKRSIFHLKFEIREDFFNELYEEIHMKIIKISEK